MKTVQKTIATLPLVLVLTVGALFLAGCETPSGGSASGATSVEALKSAANGGDADAAIKLGDIYLHGRGVPMNSLEAETWYQKASQLYQAK